MKKELWVDEWWRDEAEIIDGWIKQNLRMVEAGMMERRMNV